MTEAKPSIQLPPPANTQLPLPANEPLTAESLIEEVSIDGMCGVY